MEKGLRFEVQCRAWQTFSAKVQCTHQRSLQSTERIHNYKREFVRLAHVTRGWAVHDGHLQAGKPENPTAAQSRKLEPQSQWDKGAVLGWGWKLGSPIVSHWYESMFKGWRSWSLMPTVMAAKTTPTQEELNLCMGRASPFHFLFHPVP
jgi:hypothetical protein